MTFSDFYSDFHSEIFLIVREKHLVEQVHSRLGSEYVVSHSLTCSLTIIFILFKKSVF